jgi:cytochrome P450 family 4
VSPCRTVRSGNMSPTLLEANSLWTGWGDWFPPMGLLLVVSLVFYYWTWSQSRVVRLINAIPGPKSLPLLGNLLDLDVYNDSKSFVKILISQVFYWENLKIDFLKMTTIDWVQKYGPMYRVWLSTRPIVMLSSPELVQVR